MGADVLFRCEWLEYSCVCKCDGDVEWRSYNADWIGDGEYWIIGAVVWIRWLVWDWVCHWIRCCYVFEQRCRTHIEEFECTPLRDCGCCWYHRIRNMLGQDQMFHSSDDRSYSTGFARLSFPVSELHFALLLFHSARQKNLISFPT